MTEETAGTALPKALARRSERFDEWYTDVVRKAELADYSPVRGCMVIRPYGYALWEHIRDALDGMIKETGHDNMYFPLLIPQSYLTKEAEHVEGFAPEVAWVTRGGDSELEEPLAIRPTSETIICSMYARWIQSWRDLPVLINQWANVMRWEMRTRLFLRTTEFLWQEGHTFHATAGEAAEETDKMLGVYQRLAEDWLAIPVIPGRKTEAEKFAGADYTLSIEAMMGDGKALQSGTSHNLGQNFSRAYDIQFQDKDLTRKYPYQTSWGLSTRIIGGVIMAHGDEGGLVLPPRVAPVQLIVVPIWRSDDERSQVAGALEGTVAALKAAGVRVKVDWRDDLRPGFKYNEWELKGVPLRMEIGPRDVVAGQAVLVRRDLQPRQKESVPQAALATRVPALLAEIHTAMLERARTFRQQNTVAVATWDEAEALLAQRNVFVDIAWCGDAACEARMQERSKATIRCIPFAPPGDPTAACAVCGRPGHHRVIAAKAY
jgi:prolyl-tRNA synthetase